MSHTYSLSLCVGYTNKEVDDGYFTMVTPNFCGVGSAAHKYWVSDIKMTGYEEDPSFEMSGYNANFTILTPGGSSDYSAGKMFSYVAEWDWGEYCLLPGCWVDNVSNPITPHGEGDIQLAPGQGILLSTDAGDGDHPQILVFPEFTLN